MSSTLHHPQVLVIARSCGFKSLHLHQRFSLANGADTQLARLFYILFQRNGPYLVQILQKGSDRCFFIVCFVEQDVGNCVSDLVSCFLEVMGVRRQSSLRGSVAYDINDNSDDTFDSRQHRHVSFLQ